MFAGQHDIAVVYESAFPCVFLKNFIYNLWCIKQVIVYECVFCHPDLLANEGQIPPSAESRDIFGILGIINLLAGKVKTLLLITHQHNSWHCVQSVQCREIPLSKWNDLFNQFRIKVI